MSIKTNLTGSFKTLFFLNLTAKKKLSGSVWKQNAFIGHLLLESWINQSQPEFLAVWPISIEKLVTNDNFSLIWQQNNLSESVRKQNAVIGHLLLESWINQGYLTNLQWQNSS